MNLTLLSPEIQQFIDSKIGMDPSQLALQKNPFPSLNWIEIINQIAAKTKAKTKHPSFFNTDNIIYPSKISVEQTSSEKTALYKATLVSGEGLIDLTGGFGVDAYFFSKKVKKVIHCEMNIDLSQIVEHNFKILKAHNIECHSGDSLAILKSLSTKIDCIYIDPSRRNETKGKVFMLKDCMPNVPELLDTYFEYANTIWIKTAPILDISAGLLELAHVKNIHIVAVDNEVKEFGVTVTALCPGATETGFMKAASAENSNLFKGKKLPSAKEVAEYGYDAMLKGKPVAIHGFVNQALAFFVRLMPRKLVVAVSRKVIGG